VRLKQRLDAEGFRLPVRIDGAGRSTGGGPFCRRHIYKILANPIYVGRIAHKGQVHQGQHQPIVPQDLWSQVQQRLSDCQRTAAALNERVAINENGRRRRITKLEAAVKQLVNRAASGEARATQLLLAFVQASEARSAQQGPGRLSDADAIVMAEFARRLGGGRQ
jgi:hypothetical protein